MHIAFQTLRSSALLGLAFILPLMIMQLVNRRHNNEDFPGMLFFGLWLGPFAIGLFLLPIARARRMVERGGSNLDSAKGATLFTKPLSAAVISMALLLFPLVRVLPGVLGWELPEWLLNGAESLPGQILSFCLGLFPIAAGVLAGGPIVNTLRAGGSLFAHPLHLVIVIALSFLFATGLVFLVMDQWPCFMGVPNCD
ncbi:MAG: hypothetical protein ACKVX9_00250 [Blastocatellia bacterium]